MLLSQASLNSRASYTLHCHFLRFSSSIGTILRYSSVIFSLFWRISIIYIYIEQSVHSPSFYVFVMCRIWALPIYILSKSENNCNTHPDNPKHITRQNGSTTYSIGYGSSSSQHLSCAVVGSVDDDKYYLIKRLLVLPEAISIINVWYSSICLLQDVVHMDLTEEAERKRNRSSSYHPSNDYPTKKPTISLYITADDMDTTNAMIYDNAPIWILALSSSWVRRCSNIYKCTHMLLWRNEEKVGDSRYSRKVMLLYILRIFTHQDKTDRRMQQSYLFQKLRIEEERLFSNTDTLVASQSIT